MSMPDIGSRPVPDPTVLTTNLVDRALAAEKERVAGLLEIISNRVASLNELTNERFAAQKEAVAMLDVSNQKAIDKAENATTEKIEQLSELFRNSTSALAEKVDDLKTRVTSVESIKVGGQEQRTETRQSAAVIYGFIGAALGLLAGLGTILTLKP